MQAIEEYWKQLVKSNEFNKYILPLDEQKEIFQNLVDGRMEELK